MTRLLAWTTLAVLFAALIAFPALAQETGGQEAAGAGAHGAAAHGEDAHGEGGDGHGDVIGGPNATLWKTVNFVLLIGGAIYLLRGKVGPFFESRNKSIASGMAVADGKEREAAERLRAVEEKLSGLERDIAALKENSSHEMERDRERIQKETAAAIDRLRENAESEIASASATARARLQHHAAALALDLAEQQVLAEAKSPEAQQRLLAKAVERLANAGDASRN